MNILKPTVLLASLVLICTCFATAQIPNTISYQGVLSDVVGTAVADGNYSLTLTLYTSPTASASLWSEVQSVEVRDGVFNVHIGAVNTLNLPFDSPYYLGVRVNGAAELQPRTVLETVPYAYTARRAQIAAALESGAAGAVASLNSLTGDVTLQGGGSTTVTQAGNAITISSTGGTGGTGIQGVQNTNATLDITNGTGPIATINVAANAIRTTHLADQSVTAGKLASGVIPVTLPPSGAAGGDLTGTYPSPDIAAGAVSTAELAPMAVTGDKIATRAVGSTQLADNAVTGTKIANSAVTSAQLADNAVTSAKIVNGTIAAADLADASITAAKISGAGASTGQVLSYDGAQVGWSTVSGGGGVSGTGAAPRLALWDGTSKLSSDAKLVFSNGKLGIATGNPQATVHALALDGVLAEGTFNTGTALAPGGGTRLHWYPRKAAFRAGWVASARWDDAYIGEYSVATGYNTMADGNHSTAMGYQTQATGDASTATGRNTIATGYASTSIGYNCIASGDFSVAIGDNCRAEGSHSIAGGDYSRSTGSSSIALGYQSVARGGYSFAIGDNSETSDRYCMAVGMRVDASGYMSTALGHSTEVTGDYAMALGNYTLASGESAMAMGSNTTASGDYSTAMGYRVSTNGKEGSFGIGDKSTSTTLSIAVKNRFVARFNNGYTLFTNSGASIGVQILHNGTSWSSISDSTRKERFRTVDGEALLQDFRTLRLGSWNFKGQDPTRYRHYGPMAQEWFAAFGHDGIGAIGNDTTLAAADVDGILCIAIKALEARTAELQTVSADLEARDEELRTVKERMSAQEAELAGLRTQMQSLLSRVSYLETVQTTSSPKQASLLYTTE